MNSEKAILRDNILQCTKCDLAQTRDHNIFGDGRTDTGIMIIGETPGRDEDIQGRPFAGKL
jgi:DNA polymerase